MNIRENYIQSKKRKKKLAMLTAYDTPTAEILERAKIDMILVGDSLGMVVLGYPSTKMVTMDEMIHHSKAVRRGAPKSFIIGDLPLKGVEKGPKQALESAKRFIHEAGLNAVKLEWSKNAEKTAELLAKHRIPVMGHVGLTPQALKNGAGYKVQGQDAAAAYDILKNAQTFESAKVFSVLLECVPSAVGKGITEALKVPTIGIGSGPDCDGQVLVLHDVLGIFKKFTPRFVKRYADLNEQIQSAVERYKHEVTAGSFPAKSQSFSMKKEEENLFLEALQ